MKAFKVKSYNKLMENIINEDSIKLDGNTGDFKGKLKKRIIDALRLAKECRKAAEIARQNGNDEDAAWLDQRAADYEEAARNWNQDIIDAEDDSSADSKQDDTNKEPSQAEVAQDAANAAKRAARDAQDAANDARKAAEKLADAGQDASAAQDAAEKAQEKADEAKQAAQEAQDHADEASKAEAAGDKNKAEAEVKAAEDAQKKAEQAANEANEIAENANQKTASERAKDAADAAEEAAKNAQAKADAAQKKADNLKADGKDASEAQAEADKAKEKAEQAKKAAEEAKDHAEKAEKAEKSGDTDTANSEADKAEAAAESAKQSTSSSSDSSNNSENSSDSDSDSDSSSDSDSDNDSSSKSKSKSKSSSSSSSSDKSDDDSDDDSDDAPIKDLFADEEDIPSLPGGGGGQGAQAPRDPTVDEIIEQLSKLEGEAKRGAIDGLTDLVSGKKNESLSEAFSKGIREFSDGEWNDLNDETVDRINKVKKISTIDNIEGRKAKVKSWADNQAARQELEDEESQNVQHDILQQRAKEQELDKYNNLSGIDDFEIDFENCIRDQVEMVMQDYLTYDEINPEYELEDVIMKAEVQRMIPDEAVPTIAVFFDKSGSCSSAIPTLNNAIATVKKKYVDTGMCKLDLYYFGDRVAYNDANAYVGGSTAAWPYIIDYIKRGDYHNVIVMSDDDIGRQNNNGESYTVTGCVWWLWVDGNRAPKCVKELRGMQHNYECIIYS